MAKKKKRTAKQRPTTSTPPVSTEGAAAVPRGDGGQPAGRPNPGPAANAKAGAVRTLDRKITFRLDEARASELEGLAQAEGGSVSFMVRRLVISFLEQRKRNPWA